MKKCTMCDSEDLEQDQARGDTVCIRCGFVLSENLIVSDLTFQENSNGSSSTIGQIVNKGTGHASNSALGPGSGLGRESREATLNNGRKKIVQVSINLTSNQSLFKQFSMSLS